MGSNPASGNAATSPAGSSGAARSQSGPESPSRGEATPNPGASPAPAAAEADLDGLLAQLQADRAWLLRQIDSGRWSPWRLDLAALERELGQLLEQLERQQP